MSCLLLFPVFKFPASSPALLHHFILFLNTHTHTHKHSNSHDQDCQKQTTVVLLNPGANPAQGSGGISVTTLCTDDLQASKQPRPRDWMSLLWPSSVTIPPHGSLRFSLSLNDMGQRMDSLCRGLHFIDRTCSEGELEPKPEPPQVPHVDRKAHTLNVKQPAAPSFLHPTPAQTTRPHLHFVPSFTNNYKYMSGRSVPSKDFPPPPPPPPAAPSSSHLQPNCSSNLLRLLQPFSRSSTSASLQWSELGSQASNRAEVVLGEDDVFVEDWSQKYAGRPAVDDTVTRPGPRPLLAPLCFMDEDGDLDCCPSPLSEKTVPLSPTSLSECCRWVTFLVV